jgi:hypothetical protein
MSVDLLSSWKYPVNRQQNQSPLDAMMIPPFFSSPEKDSDSSAVLSNDNHFGHNFGEWLCVSTVIYSTVL